VYINIGISEARFGKACILLVLSTLFNKKHKDVGGGDLLRADPPADLLQNRTGNRSHKKEAIAHKEKQPLSHTIKRAFVPPFQTRKAFPFPRKP
jgi:hypothetical protein